MPPEMQQKIAELEIKKQDADSRSKVAEAKVAETVAKVQGGGQPGGVAPFDPMKLAELQLKQQELHQRGEEARLEAMNRKRDRESHERLATMKFAEQMADNPAGIPIAESFISPETIRMAEQQEEPLNIGQIGQNMRPIE